MTSIQIEFIRNMKQYFNDLGIPSIIERDDDHFNIVFRVNNKIKRYMLSGADIDDLMYEKEFFSGFEKRVMRILHEEY